MTPQDHNKALGIMHLIYGGFHTLVLIMVALICLLFVGVIGSMPEEPGAPPMVFFVAIMGMVLVFYTLLAVPALLAGYALLKKRSWARIAGIVSAFLAALSFPFGTALCVYSLWFFFGEGSRHYEGCEFRQTFRGALRDAPTFRDEWDKRSEERTRESEPVYVPPTHPPDWRS